MKRTRFDFPNAQGDSLAGLLEMPDEGDYTAMALFAHCFTCGKDSAAASRIARHLVGQGIAVLRFDFTGLGSSDGEFANSTINGYPCPSPVRRGPRRDRARRICPCGSGRPTFHRQGAISG